MGTEDIKARYTKRDDVRITLNIDAAYNLAVEISKGGPGVRLMELHRELSRLLMGEGAGLISEDCE